jgi:hypothetical protein
MGYFQQGSTIIVLAGRQVRLACGVWLGATIRMGQPLLIRTASSD